MDNVRSDTPPIPLMLRRILTGTPPLAIAAIAHELVAKVCMHRQHVRTNQAAADAKAGGGSHRSKCDGTWR